MDECLATVKNGQRNVFVQVRKRIQTNEQLLERVIQQTLTYLFDGIMRDFKQTGKCSLQIAKKTFFSFPVSIALKKNSPYTTTIGRA